MSVYGQPKMLEKWWATLACYPRSVLDQIEFVLVDDAGTPPVEAPKLDAHIQIFRVLENRFWNQPGARNLAAEKARGKVLCFLDPDMVITPEDIDKFLSNAKGLESDRIYLFALRHSNGQLDTSSPNTWMLHRSTFLRSGGYDEDYAGHKGWSDVQLKHILQQLYKVTVTDKLAVDYYRTDQIEDAQVNTLDRDVRHNKQVHLRKISEMRRVGGWQEWLKRHKGKNIRFKWTRVL